MTDIDVFGDLIDPSTVEGWVKTTLQAWIVNYLAHEERRLDLDPRTLPEPRSWPTVSDFDPELHDRMPAISIVSPGVVRAVHDRGAYRKTWRIEVGVAVAGKNEDEARLLAGIYLTAIQGCLVQGDPTLGGNAESTIYTPPDDYAYGITEQGGQRAIYGTAFEVTVKDALNVRKGPTEPLEDPYDPPSLPQTLTEAEITVASTPFGATPTPPEDTP